MLEELYVDQDYIHWNIRTKTISKHYLEADIQMIIPYFAICQSWKYEDNVDMYTQKLYVTAHILITSFQRTVGTLARGRSIGCHSLTRLCNVSWDQSEDSQAASGKPHCLHSRLLYQKLRLTAALC